MCRHTTPLATFAAVLFTVLLAACGPAKLLERDRPGAAFEKAMKKLERDPGKSAELIAVAAEAYAQLQADDQYALAEARTGGRDNYGEQAVAVLTQLSERRERVDLLRRRLRRVAGFRAWDQERDYLAELAQARVIAASRLLVAAGELLPAARAGDRFRAREAYGLLVRRDRYASATDVPAALRDELLDLGTVRVSLAVDGDVRGREAALGERFRKTFSRDWVETAFAHERPGNWADLYAYLDVASPPALRIHETAEVTRYERELVTYRQRGVDTAGRALCDTLRETVRAEVETVCRTFEQAVGATIYVELPDGTPLREYRRGASADESWTGVDIRGDRRALEGVSLPTASITTFGLLDERRLLDAAYAHLGGALGKLDADELLGERRLASTE